MDLLVGTRVRFEERYRPAEVVWKAIGVVVDMELRPAPLREESWVRARFGDFITPWIGVEVRAGVLDWDVDPAG
jgi:hypothetical protein